LRRADRHDELDRRLARALVQPLEKGVLRIGAALAPERRRRRGDKRAAVACNVLAVAFQHELLQIGG